MYEFLDYQTQDVMTRDVVTIGPESKLSEAVHVFSEHDFNALPVVDESGRLVGLTTKLDLLRAFRFDDDHVFPPYEEIMQRPVSSVMTREVRTVRPRTPLSKVLELLVQLGCKSLPVVDDGILVAVVAREDVMRGLANAALGTPPRPLEDPY